MTEDTELSLLAKQLGIPYLKVLPDAELIGPLIANLPYAFAKKHLLIPLDETPQQLTVAFANPLNLQAIDELRLMLDKEICPVVAPSHHIQTLIDRCYHQKKEASAQFLTTLEEAPGQHSQEDSDDIYDLLDTDDEAPVIRLLNMILSEAISQGASDIHFEPQENDLKVRYRIDGVLQTRQFPMREYHVQLLTRIKVLAKMDIAEHRLPQDGRMKLKMGGRELDFRVSTVPIAHGERIVLRILDKENVILGLDQLGMLPSMLDAFSRLISLPEGIILVTGPTGSGKTTTLYSALWEVYDEQNNIMTVEDPVEYKIEGISQIAVHPKIGLSFATGLRHVLRQDPDVVMIGEIRDSETAEIAIQAALTGHLVLSTLHTNDAPSAIPRLMDMGIEPYLLSSTIVGVLAQRLVRRICPHCRERYVPTEAELEQIGLKSSQLNGGILYHGIGCEACFFSGYKGRHGIYELLPISSELQSLIVQRPSSSQLKKQALKEGFTTLKTHGAHLVRTGVTTLAEVLRVAQKAEIETSHKKGSSRG